jgi:hypothetical protein
MKAPLIATCFNGTCTLGELEGLYSRDRLISYRTFARRVDVRGVSEALGYAYGRWARGLRLSKDYHVEFFSSAFRGRRCWHLIWSAQDYVFQNPKDGGLS